MRPEKRSKDARPVRRGGDYGAGLLVAIAAASATWLFDPRSGRRRRALLRDRAHRITREAREFAAKAGRDAQHRMHGLYEGSVWRLRASAIDDRVLVERIRAELGRLSSHPGPIEVSCSKGVARLRGDILESEVESVLHGVSRVRGVRSVVNEMRAHADPGHISALQGDSDKPPPQRFEYLQTNWSPAPRLLAGATGVMMIVRGLGRRSAAGMGLAAGGAALLGRSISNAPLLHLLGVRANDSDGVLVQKTIMVYADIDEVYSRWRDLENFPAFMSHVKEVRKIDDTHYQWRVDGPAGSVVEWTAQITADVPRELIAWRTVPDASVHSSGVVQFEPTPYGGTRVHVRMSYRPPANIAGHTIAKVFGRDPKRQIDADLMRFKQFVETARRPRGAEAAQQPGGESATRH